MALILAVSPHLDDAILSAGGTLATLAAAGAEVVVFTVFTADPAGPFQPSARELHDLWGLPDDEAVGARRDEDRAACAVIGARCEHGGLLDAIYRVRGDGSARYDSVAALFDATLAGEQDTCAAADQLVGVALETLEPDLVLGPAGVGNHIDHVIVNAALREPANQAPVGFWEDLPYAIDAPAGESGPSTDVPVSADMWARKRTALARYRSQLPMLSATGDWQHLLLGHAERRGGSNRPAERFFWPTDDDRGPSLMAALARR